MKYHTMINSMIVKPENEPIFSEQATIVRLADGSGGLFIEIEQDYGEDGKRLIGINIEEWDVIKTAVEKMVMVVKGVEDGNSSSIE